LLNFPFKIYVYSCIWYNFVGFAANESVSIEMNKLPKLFADDEGSQGVPKPLSGFATYIA